MTPQEKLIAISGYLPHGLKVTTYKKSYINIPIGVLNYYNAEDRDCISFTADEGYYLCNIEETIPILFPIACLYKEIRVKSYNNGEPFIPIVELAKTQNFKSKSDYYVERERCIVSKNEPYSMFYYMVEFISGDFIITSRCKSSPAYHKSIHCINQLQLFDLLNSWYIDYRGLIEQGESISVLDINPNLYA